MPYHSAYFYDISINDIENNISFRPHLEYRHRRIK